MDSIKVKVNVAGHSFDAEGPEHAISEKFDRWQSLVEKALAVGNGTPGLVTERSAAHDAPARAAADPEEVRETLPAPNGSEFTREQLGKLFDSDERRGIVWLRVPVHDEADAALAMLYGFRALRSMDAVSTLRLSAAMERAGHGVPRLDRPLAQYIEARLIIPHGVRRGRTYRLTATGLAQARRILNDLLAELP
jgi:hypothetical protein